MSRESKKILELGIGFAGAGIISFQDLILKSLYKLLKIEYEEINVNFLFIAGLLLIGIAIIMNYLDNKKEKTIAIIGLDTIKSTELLKDTNIINVINDIKILNTRNSKKIIKEYLNELEKSITNYSSYNISYFGIAPLPFVALAGKYYRKIKMYSHYEYYQRNDKIVSLNFKPTFLLPRLEMSTNLTKKSNVAIITIETTCRINQSDLEQFKNCDNYSFYLEEAKTNSIVSEKQLEAYSEQIANEIYKISKTNIKTIYLLSASQSSLIFEIFRKLNQNRVVEIVVCSYSRMAKYKYNWGITIYGNNSEKYVELRDINGKN